MTRTIITKLAVLTALALLALVSVQAMSAKTMPRAKVSVSASLARIQHPTGVTELARLTSLQGGPLGVYAKRQAILVPAFLAGILHPSGVYVTGR